MATKKGKVTFVNVKEFDDGGKSVSFKVGGDDKWYRAGKKRYSGILEKGNTIEFEYSSISDSAAKLTGAPTLVSGKSAGEGGSAPSGGAKDWAKHDGAIQYQSSRKDALAFVTVLVTAGAVKLPAKEAAKLEALEALIDHYTAAYYADIETRGAVARLKGPAKDEEDAEESEDEGEADDEEDEG